MFIPETGCVSFIAYCVASYEFNPYLLVHLSFDFEMLGMPFEETFKPYRLLVELREHVSFRLIELQTDIAQHRETMIVINICEVSYLTDDTNR